MGGGGVVGGGGVGVVSPRAWGGSEVASEASMAGLVSVYVDYIFKII